MTVSNAANRSSKKSNEDLEAVLASLRSSTTESKAVSVECPLLKPDWLLSRRLFCVRKAVTWLNTTRSSVFTMKGRRETGYIYVYKGAEHHLCVMFSCARRFQHSL